MDHAANPRNFGELNDAEVRGRELKIGMKKYQARKNGEEANAAEPASAFDGPSGRRAAVVDLMGHLADAVGNTPLIRLDKKAWGLGDVELYAKAEFLNPGGSGR